MPLSPYLTLTLKFYRVYSLSSALLIHVYQLHIAMPATDVATQCRIRICIACLEKISKVWLVAKMTQNLFEYILSEKGLGDFLEDGPGETHNKTRHLLGKRSHSLVQRKIDGVGAGSSQTSGEPLRPQSPVLTPALLAHLFAALKSGTSSGSSENGDSPKSDPQGNNIACNSQPPQVTSFIGAEFHNPQLDTQNVPYASHQFPGGSKSEQIFEAQEPANMPMSRSMPLQNPVDYSANMYADSQIMAAGNLPARGLQIPLDQGYVQNLVDGSQYFPNEVGELQYNWPANGVSYYTTGLDFPPTDTATVQLPASTGPNVLEWSVDFIHV